MKCSNGYTMGGVELSGFMLTLIGDWRLFVVVVCVLGTSFLVGGESEGADQILYFSALGARIFDLSERELQ